MKQRTITSVLLIIIFLPLIIVESLFPLFQIAAIVMAVIASYEMIRMYEKEKPFPLPIKIIIIFCTLLLYFSVMTEWSPTTIPAGYLSLFNIKLELISSIILIAVLLFGCTVFSKTFNGADVGKALTIVIYVGLGFGAITILRYLGRRYIVYLFLITVLTDVFAYFTGMLFGKHKMAPLISPKKTWEGAIGGSLVATIIGSCFAIFYGSIFQDLFGPIKDNLLSDIVNLEQLGTVFTVIILIMLTLFTSIISQIGDLVASRLKRTYEIKDFGSCFPGHGGILDRFDSVLFASMFILCILKILNYLWPVVNGVIV